LILAWLYVCWAVLLLGAEVAFAAQNLGFARREMRYGEAGPAEQEAVALEIAVAIAVAYRRASPPPTAEDLADTLDEPVRLVRRLCDALDGGELIVPVRSGDSKDPGYVPARPLRDITVAAVLGAVRGEDRGSGPRSVQRSSAVQETLREMQGAWHGVADETSLARLSEVSEEDRLAGC
jgi:membrane protein